MPRILLLLLLLSTQCYAQTQPWHTFQNMQVGMMEEQVEKIFRKDWKPLDAFDTGPFRTYFVLSPNDDKPAPGSFRLLLYFLSAKLGSKEMRISANQLTIRHTLDSVKQMLIKQYGPPLVDSTVATRAGLEGSVRFFSWTISNPKENAEWRIDLAAYKMRTRRDYTIMLAAFSKEYNELFPVKGYLHY